MAAQRVQRSGFPSAYAVYEPDARALASALTGFSPAAFACHLGSSSRTSAPAARRAAALRRTLAPAFGTVEVSVAEGSRLQIAAPSSPQGWAMASYLVSHAPGLGLRQVGFDGRDWSVDSAQGWRRGGSAPGSSVMVG